MQLQLIMPHTKPKVTSEPTCCPYQDCAGKQLKRYQEVTKPLKDAVYESVAAHRHRCLRCGRTFRVYPAGVTRAHTSERVKGLGVFLYMLGLSYGAVSAALDALGVYMSKSSVHGSVREARANMPEFERRVLLSGIRTPTSGTDVTSVKCNGRWLPLALTTDGAGRMRLVFDELSGEDAELLRAWLEPHTRSIDASVQLIR